MNIQAFGLRTSLIAVAIAAMSLPLPAEAQTITAFKTGEAVSGMTKQCFYSALGNAYTQTVSSVSLCPLTIQVQATPPVQQPAPQINWGAGVAFKTGELNTGMTKQCFYNYLGSQRVITISSAALCPLSIPVGN